jgi:hypothetical protein
MTGIAVALVFGGLSAIALYCTLDALRWREHARSMNAFGLTVAFVAVTIAAVWVGIQYPHGGMKISNGFGPDWRCANLARGDVCVRDPRMADGVTRR